MLDTTALWLEAQAITDALPERSWQRLTRKNFASGAHARKRTGEGQEFWQYRPLGDGDSTVGVDWRKSARGDTLLKREREQQSQQRFWLWCDMSPSMHYAGSRAVRSKAAQAYVLAAVLMQLAAHAGEEMKLLGAPAAARADVPLLLAQPSPPAFVQLPADTILFVLSDFLGLAIESAAAPLISLHIADPDELDFPFDGAVRFEGLEGEPSQFASNAQALREAYVQAQSDLQKRIAAASRLHMLCSTAVSPANQLLALLEQMDA
jgi:uncharacterized protein (DUF58 family)